MQVMSDQMLTLSRSFLREAGGDLRLVQRAMVEARRATGEDAPAVSAIRAKIAELVRQGKRGAA